MEEEEVIVQPHMVEERCDHEQCVEEDIIIFGTISPEKKTHGPMLIPFSDNQTGAKHTYKKTINQLVNEQTDKDIIILALKGIIQC